MIDKPMSKFGFRFMTLYFRFRDYFFPPTKILEQVGIQSGMNVLDFGAGTGSFSVPVAQLVYPSAGHSGDQKEGRYQRNQELVYNTY
jgi:ubiquinone/menaquinone biosynthesis C-methylase UbiE